MKRIIPLSFFLSAAAVSVQAQTPAPRPTPRPTRSAPVAPDAPVAPIAPLEPSVELPLDLDLRLDIDAARLDAGDLRSRIRDAENAGEQVRTLLDATRFNDLRLPDDLVNANFAVDAARAGIEGAMLTMPADLAPMHGRLLTPRLRAPWVQGDPADSLYRVAREAINRGDYRRAAQLFSELTQRYPKSAYAPTATYYQAFALYRIGTTDELRTASHLLEALNAREFDRRDDVDVAALAARIDGTLAQRGDRDAAARIARQANRADSTGCDRDEVAVRVEALSALDRMDRAEALPVIRRVLQRKDACSTELRRRALFMLVRDRTDSSAYPLLVDVARTDPSSDVRTDAVMWLSRLPSDAAVTALESLTHDSDERVQRAAIRALTTSENPKARPMVRAVIERKDTPMQLRLEAISSFARGDRATADDASYLRSLYATADNPSMKNAIMSAVSRIDDPANAAWLLGIARNQNENDDVRAMALGRVGRMSVPIMDLVKLYDAADTRSMRDQLISVFSTRSEPEATDKLIDIARTGTDPMARRMAINALSRKNDPRTTKLLLDLVEKQP